MSDDRDGKKEIVGSQQSEGEPVNTAPFVPSSGDTANMIAIQVAQRHQASAAAIVAPQELPPQPFPFCPLAFRARLVLAKKESNTSISVSRPRRNFGMRLCCLPMSVLRRNPVAAKRSWPASLRGISKTGFGTTNIRARTPATAKITNRFRRSCFSTARSFSGFATLPMQVNIEGLGGRSPRLKCAG